MRVDVDRRDRGQAAITVIVVAVVLFVATMTGLTALGARVTDQARVQSVADAAALASVEVGRAAAEGLVVGAGAEIVSWSRGPGAGEVTVVVRLRDVTATARASNDP
jgi:hypothetical protein